MVLSLRVCRWLRRRLATLGATCEASSKRRRRSTQKCSPSLPPPRDRHHPDWHRIEPGASLSVRRSPRCRGRRNHFCLQHRISPRARLRNSQAHDRGHTSATSHFLLAPTSSCSSDALTSGGCTGGRMHSWLYCPVSGNTAMGSQDWAQKPGLRVCILGCGEGGGGVSFKNSELSGRTTACLQRGPSLKWRPEFQSCRARSSPQLVPSRHWSPLTP